MSSEATKETELELVHVLFIDIVGFSKRLINEQRALLDTINRIVRDTSPFRREEATGKLRKIPTSDGLALVFYTAKKEPVECALEIARANIEHTELELRMGVHTGLVSGVIDVNESAMWQGPRSTCPTNNGLRRWRTHSALEACRRGSRAIRRLETPFA